MAVIRRYAGVLAEFEPEYTQVPRKIPADLDVDRHWKMLLLSRRVLDMDEFARYVRRENIEIGFDDSWETQGNYVGFQRTPYSIRDYMAEDDPMSKVSRAPQNRTDRVCLCREDDVLMHYGRSSTICGQRSTWMVLHGSLSPCTRKRRLVTLLTATKRLSTRCTPAQQSWPLFLHSISARPFS